MLKLLKRLLRRADITTGDSITIAVLLALLGVSITVSLRPIPPAKPDPVAVELAALRAHVDQRFDQLALQCGPMVITTYGDDKPSTITGPDGRVLEWGDPQ
jgi:hypothetical protein